MGIKSCWYIFYGCRRNILEKKLADADVSEEDQNNLLKYLEKKETEYMRLKRHKMGVSDFDLLTIIGKGAFGEVCFTFFMYKFSFLQLSTPLAPIKWKSYLFLDSFWLKLYTPQSLWLHFWEHTHNPRAQVCRLTS